MRRSLKPLLLKRFHFTNSISLELLLLSVYFKERMEVEEKIKSSGDIIARDGPAKKRLEKEYQRALQKKARLELDVRDLTEQMQVNQATKEANKAELQTLEKKISDLSRKKKVLQQDYETKVAAEEKLRDRLAFCGQRVNELYAKQGRKKVFGNKKQRDIFLSDEIKTLKKDMTTQQSQVDSAQKELKSAESKRSALAVDFENKEREMKSLKDQLAALSVDEKRLKEDRDEQQNQRKEMQRAENDIKKQVADLQVDVEKATRDMQFTMDSEMYKGLTAVRAMAREQKMLGIHGPIIELFTCEEKFQKCVETTAGNSLFHVVVDTDEIGAKLIKMLNDKKAGRVTFIPLNRQTDRKIDYPKSSDVIPLIHKLNYDPRFELAMRQIFGNTLLTRSLEVAATMAREHNFNTITLSGDQVNKKGALTGGFIDQKKSRLQTQNSLKDVQAAHEIRLKELDEIQSSMTQFDQKVTRILGDLHKITEKRTHLRNLHQQVSVDRDAEKSELAQLETFIERNSKLVSALSSTIAQAQNKIAALTEEMESELLSGLSAVDQKLLTELDAETGELRQKVIDAGSARSMVESEKTVLDNMLTNNLLKRQNELNHELESSAFDVAAEKHEQSQHELRAIEQTLSELEAQRTEVDKGLQAASKELSDQQSKLDKINSQEQAQVREIAKESKSLEQLLSKRGFLLQKIEDCQKQIRDLGTLPSDAFSKYTGWSEQKLMASLEKCNAKLKQYSHVNKKAIDQFINFTEQREDLIARKQELDDGRKSILDLIAHLDNKKDEAINRTYKSIAKNFTTVFTELVPEGKGTLVMQTSEVGAEDVAGAPENPNMHLLGAHLLTYLATTTLIRQACDSFRACLSQATKALRTRERARPIRRSEAKSPRPQWLRKKGLRASACTQAWACACPSQGPTATRTLASSRAGRKQLWPWP